MAVDVRGMGQSQSLACSDNDFFSAYGADYMYAAHGQMLDRPYIGRRVHDLLSVLELLKSKGYRKIHLHGRGMGAILAAFAACLHDAVSQVSLHDALLSYHELTQSPIFDWPFSFLPWDVMHHFDLPDCYRLLHRKKKLSINRPWDARMQPWKKDKLKAHLRLLKLPPNIVK